MTFRVAINGYGRIGQSVLRSAYQRDDLSFDIVAINELAEIETIAYLTQYDTTHGRFKYPVVVKTPSSLGIADKSIQVSSCEDLDQLDWKTKAIDLVFDCTGKFSAFSDLTKHVNAGADRVLLSQPGDGSLDKTIIYGQNHRSLVVGDSVVSAASCTSNAVVPVLHCINERFGINSGSLMTIHSAMNDQPVIDAYHHSDLRRTRSAMHNIVPVDTELVKGIERIMPSLGGKLSATAMRVPTINVSAMEVCVYSQAPTTVDDVNRALQQLELDDTYQTVRYTETPLASCDFIQDSHSCIVDGSQTRVSGENFIKVLIWFDNEWAFANRMLDIANYWFSLSE